MELKSYHREYSDAEFKAWLEKQDPETEYDYVNCRNCVYAQFLKSNGIETPLVGPNDWCFEEFRGGIRSKGFAIPDASERSAFHMHHKTPKEMHGNTFGKVLERLNYLLEQKELETVTT